MSCRVLLVDDDDFIQMTTEASLKQLGYAVEIAEDGQVAWEKMTPYPEKYDLILLDKKMPRLDGISLLQQMKADTRLNELPVVMLAGESNPEDVSEGLAAGAYYYLAKPAEQNVLRVVIENALADSRKRRELKETIIQHQGGLPLITHAEFTFRTLSEARDVALILAGASTNPIRTINGYSELLVNAVEHGNLGIGYEEKGQLLAEDRWAGEIERRLQTAPYSARTVKVNLARTAKDLTVTIADEGEGFDWHDFMEIKAKRAFDIHGRGIAMSKIMSFDHIEYLGKGNTVVVVTRVT